MLTFPARAALLAVLSLSLLVDPAAVSLAREATPEGVQVDGVQGVQVDGVTVLEPDATYAGLSRGELDAWFWQLGVNAPPLDVEGEGCGYGQFGPVFLVPSTFTPVPINRTCVVAEGTALFVSFGGSECSTVEPPPFFGRNEAELRACTAAFTDTTTNLEATINGEAVPNIEAYRTSSPLFTMTFLEDNIYRVPSGVALSVSDSYSFIIAPPPPGEYELTTSADLFDVEGELIELSGTIRIVVREPQIIEPNATPEAGTSAATPES